MCIWRAVTYNRCSTEEESQRDALEKQVSEAVRCIQEEGWVLVDTYVEAKSGTSTKGRTEYNRLFQDLQTDQFDVIVIKSQDRLMRNVKDWYLFLDRLQAHGKFLYLYLERKFYSTDDALITGIKAILAEEYSRELSRKIVNAHRNRQKHGGKVMITNKVYGYQKNLDGSVSAVDAEAVVIRQIFAYSAAGYGSRVIAKLLKGKDIRSKYGNYMTATTVGRMIKNPMYKGVFVMNRQHFDFATKHILKNPEEKWIYQEGLIPAIVDKQLWEDANTARDGRAERNRQTRYYPKGSKSGKYALTGKIVCGVCGKPYYRIWRRGYADPEKVIVEWKCSSYIENGRTCGGCDNIHLDEEILFRLLENLSVKYDSVKSSEKNGLIKKVMQLLKKVLDSQDYGKDIVQLEVEEASIGRKKQLILDKLLEGILSDEDYKRGNLRLDEAILKNADKQNQLQYQVHQQGNTEQRLEEIRQKLEQGGLEKATVYQILNGIHDIVAHEWQLEVRFNPSAIIGRPDIIEEREESYSVFLDYPFAPTTERGRSQDRLRILHMLDEDPDLTAGIIAKQLERTKSMINSRIREMRQKEYMVFCGAGGHGYWDILPKGKMVLEKRAEDARS